MASSIVLWQFPVIRRRAMMMIPDVSQLPGQIEAALQFLCLTEQIAAPKNFGGPPEAGRDLTKTELEVKDSALIVLLEYLNHPVPAPEQRQPLQPTTTGKPGDLPI